jgi:endo-1,4-beta-xylanase
MKKLFGFFAAILPCIMLSGQVQSDYVPLKELFKNDFLVGVAVNDRCFTGESARLLLDNYNTMTAENAMKPAGVLVSPAQRPSGSQQAQGGQSGPPQAGQPRQGMGGMSAAKVKPDTIDGLVFNWAAADRTAEFARANKMTIHGHTLVWHNQTPASFFTNNEGKLLDKEELYSRLRVYMTAVMNRYKDVTFCWDVVNEALSDNEGEIYRMDSKWFQICGKDYIANAFRIARSINPNVKLIYNDYNLVNPAKLERSCTMLKELLDAGVPIDVVGMQGHWSNDITAEMIQTAIDRFSALGLKIQITELDLTTYTSYHGDGAKNQVQETQKFTEELQNIQAEKYKSFFEVFHKNAGKITAVTFWGLDDGKTWLNNFPVRGRKDYPLLFDDQLKPKKAYYSIKSIYKQ